MGRDEGDCRARHGQSAVVDLVDAVVIGEGSCVCR